ncbi:hypothetical protein Zmor_006663 [Zophobas morio]|uniref:Uncharacterized protein n=1 Tax=Zophobas morio TaxID=2755281 RepID=A0AA38IQL7_9CUCU|nr:hypothetical protein Zmor_006663 [Zophobas morio]
MTKVGSRESQNPGIFRGLIDFTAELDAGLSDHLKEATVFKGTSKTVQNELLDAINPSCKILKVCFLRCVLVLYNFKVARIILWVM